VARYDLRLSSDEFYALTPRQLDGLAKRHQRATEEREFLFAQLASCVVNFSMCHPKDPVKASDFMPSEWVKKVQPVKRKRMRDPQVIAEEIRNTMNAIMNRNRR
jgi:hypothetical protein